MNGLAQRKWHPRHWLLPLGLMGTSIMLVFVLNIFVPHKGHFLPSVDQYNAHLLASEGLVHLGLLLTWYSFWFLFIFGSLLIPYFILRSVQFLRAGGHNLSDQDPMETAGWFGIPLSLGMYGNVSSFAAVIFFGLNNQADDIIWPFWLAYDLAVAALALTLFVWYLKARARLKEASGSSANQASMVVPFSLGFMALNIAGPGALGEHTALTATSLVVSLVFVVLSAGVFLSYFRVFRGDFMALLSSRASLNDRTSQEKIWAQVMNFGTAITTFNVLMIAMVRNYLNYGHHFAEFDLATKNLITWGAAGTVTMALLVLLALWRNGFFRHLFQEQRPLIFSLGLVCMLVSSYVITALFTTTALKTGLLSSQSPLLYGIVGVEALLLLVNLFVVAALVYRMIIRGNIQSWQADEISHLLPR
ncbi:TsoY family (seleno)protein [Marinobacter sp.]|uniref:TsoY family (seleno)protein n=1 Tax=Marinobacter sp. TaxID=50741 RepID=UPI003A903C23